MFGIDGFFLFLHGLLVVFPQLNDVCLKYLLWLFCRSEKIHCCFPKTLRQESSVLIFKKEIFFSKLSTKFQLILSRNFFLLCIIDRLSFCSFLFLSDLFSDFLFLIISWVFLDSQFHVSVYLGNYTTPFTLHKYFFVPKTWEV